jgi:hypothetical protein
MRPKTDIVSNNILIEALQEPDGLNAVLKGKLPSQTLPAFLHEATHHWCFQSPIGATIAALRARSDEDIWRAKTQEDVERAAAFRVAAERLGEAYRPLSEGLALFAQHYLRMEADGLAVPPEYWTTSHYRDDPEFLSRSPEMFRDPERLRPDDIPDSLFAEYCDRSNALFDEARKAESQIDEIRRISMSRFDAAGEGYLPGLLLVKRVYNRIARARPDLAAPTTFLLWAKDFLFHDAVLALDAASGQSQRTFERLRQRLALFDSASAPGMVQEFARIAETKARNTPVCGWPPTLTEGLDLPPGGDGALHERLVEIVGLGDETNLNATDPISLVTQYRSIFRDFVLLGRVTGTLKRVNPGCPSLKDVPDELRDALGRAAGFVPDPSCGLHSMMFIPMAAPLAVPSAPATVDLLFWSAGNRTVVATYTGTELVAKSLKTGSMLTQAAIDAVEAGLAERLVMDGNVESIDRRVSEVLAWAFKDFEGNVRSNLHDHTDALVRDCLFGALRDNGGVAFDRFRDRGLFPIFDKMDRPARFSRLCAAVACKESPDPSELADMLAWSAAREPDLGFPLVSVAGDLVQTAL